MRFPLRSFQKRLQIIIGQRKGRCFSCVVKEVGAGNILNCGSFAAIHKHVIQATIFLLPAASLHMLL
jgi:hypothetical protein